MFVVPGMASSSCLLAPTLSTLEIVCYTLKFGHGSCTCLRLPTCGSFVGSWLNNCRWRGFFLGSSKMNPHGCGLWQGFQGPTMLANLLPLRYLLPNYFRVPLLVNFVELWVTTPYMAVSKSLSSFSSQPLTSNNLAPSMHWIGCWPRLSWVN